MRNCTLPAAAALLLALAACTRPNDAGSAPAPQTTDGGGAVTAHAAGSDAATAINPATRLTDNPFVESRTPPALFDPAMALPMPELEYRGAAALGLALRRLGQTQRVLMIGAHPDDENTAVLAELALGDGADVAYLSLTRGEGGQNLIGGELEEALGLIRTEELLAARRLDGAVQFFTRAYDYGYSRSADEAFQHWPHDSILSDVVAVVRAWKPDVIISQFTGTPRDGHGQHQAAGILAREAYTAAADPARFPRQIAAGLAPHAAQRFYQSWYRTPDERDDLVALETGALDPLLGRSHFQVAMASRSRHRSQDMGQAQPMGPRRYTLSAVAPGPETVPANVFAGLDQSLADRIDGDFGEGLYEAARLEAQGRFGPVGIADIGAALQNAVEILDHMYEATRDPTARFHIAAERADAARAALLALGVQLDVTADRPTVSPGTSITLELALWNGGTDTLAVRRLEPELPEGWWAESDDAPVRHIAPGQVARRTFRVHLPHDADVDVPYFLERPRAVSSDMYLWPADYAVRGRAFEPQLLRGVALVANGLRIVDDVERVEVDPARGEVREPVLVLPAAALDVEPDVIIVPIDDDGRPLVQPAPRASLRIENPARASMRIETEPLPQRFAEGDFTLSPVARDSIGVATPGYTIVDYPHIQPRLVPEPRDVLVRAFNIDVPHGVTVAYVPGSGDEVPAAIGALGLDVDTLPAADIASADLARYDVILTGARAYEVHPQLSAPATRSALDRWIRGGGALIVQYNKYAFADEDMALLPLAMARPHDRVTDETAPVTLLEPTHPILSEPNRIGPADFEGWVQERGLYFAHTWDDAYTPLLEMADPDMPPMRGSLLAARMGGGWYVYTGLALFRQLPAGVPGAYRLLANLLALGAD